MDNLISPEMRSELAAACDRVISRTRSGSWTHRRTVGKQFPPFDNDNPDSWGVQHLMHPDLGEPIFAEWYTSEPLVNAVSGLLVCQEDQLQMGECILEQTRYSHSQLIIELFNLLINPESHQFALRWHRDDVKETALEEEERDSLSIWHHGVCGILLDVTKSNNLCRFNGTRRCIQTMSKPSPTRNIRALYTDSCLFVVPGSHKSPRTPEQRARSNTMDPPIDPLNMPGSIKVTLHRRLSDSPSFRYS